MASDSVPDKTPTLATQVSRAVIWNTLFIPLRALSEVAATLIKLNLLSPASYGLLALVSGATNGLGTWIDLGTTRALPKYIPETSRAGGPRATLRLLLAVLALQVVTLLVVAIGLLTLRDGYLASLRDKILGDARLGLADQQSLIGVVQQYGWLLIGAILALLLLGVGYDMFMACLNSFFKQRAWNGVDLAARLLPPLLASGAILVSYTLPDSQRWAILGVLVAMVVAPAVAVALAAWQTKKLWREIDTGQPADSEITPPFRAWLPPGFTRYAGVSFLMTATDFLASKSFAVFLARDIGDVAMLWAGASVVGMVLGYLYTPMVGVQVPLFTRVRAGEGGSLQGAYQSLARLQVLLLVPGGIGLALLAQPVLAVLAPQYTSAASLVWVLTPCLFLESMLTTAHNALIVYERLRVIVISRLLTLSVAPLVLAFQPVLGIVGVALAFGIARLLAGAWATGNGYRLLGLRWPWRFTLRVLLASAIMAVVVATLGWLLPPIISPATILLRLRGAAMLLGIGIAGAITFLVVLRLTGGLDPQDRDQLARMKLPLRKWVLKILGV